MKVAKTKAEKDALIARLKSSTTIMQSGCSLEPNEYDNALIGDGIHAIEWNDAETGERMSLILQKCSVDGVSADFPINPDQIEKYPFETTVTIVVKASPKGNRVSVKHTAKVTEEAPETVGVEAGTND